MLITKQSMISGQYHTRDIPITEGEYSEYIRVADAVKIQQFFPRLSPDECEFLMTGITSEEWDETFEDME